MPVEEAAGGASEWVVGDREACSSRQQSIENIEKDVGT